MSTGPEFFKSAFSVDNVIFGFNEGDLKILLIKRGEEPFNDMWALPGDLVYPDESLKASSKRVLKQLTGLENLYLEQVKAFGIPDRHPVGRVITIAYYALVRIDRFSIKASSWAQEAKWHLIKDVPQLAFDHNIILDTCFASLKKKIKTQPIGFELLPPKFTLTELQHLYEAILELELDKRNFRKKILSMQLLVDLDEHQKGVAHRPAKMYRFNKEKYQELTEDFSYSIK